MACTFLVADGPPSAIQEPRRDLTAAVDDTQNRRFIAVVADEDERLRDTNSDVWAKSRPRSAGGWIPGYVAIHRFEASTVPARYR